MEDIRNQASSLEPGDEAAFREVGHHLSAITADSNATVLDNGLDVALIFFDRAPVSVVGDCWPAVVTNTVDKALGGRASSQLKGRKVILKVMEVADLSACSLMLITKLGDKRPKIPPSCIDIICEGMVLFGIGSFPVKDILKELPAVFNGNNSQARDAAMKLLLELHRWTGKTPIQPVLDGLRTAQQAEFEKLLAEVVAAPVVPTLYTKRDRLAIESGATIASRGPQTNARAFCEEMDLGKRLKTTDFADLIASEKWSDQNTALLLLQKTMGPTPVLKHNQSIHDIVGQLHGFLKAGHVQVQMLSLRILGTIAESLQDKAAADLRPLINTLAQRTKEKKLIVDLLDAFKKMLRHSFSLESATSDLVEVLKGKSPPHAKICVLELLEFAVANASTCSAESAQCIVEAMATCCEESDPKVREASLRALATVIAASKSGDKRSEVFKHVVRVMETTSNKLYQKVLSFVATAPTTGAPESTADVIGKGAASVDKSKPVVAGKAAASVPKVKTAGPGTVGGKKAASNAAVEDDTVEEGLMGLEQATEILQAEMAGTDWDAHSAKMVSAKWQEKLEALTDMDSRITADRKEADGMLLYAMVSYVSKQTAGFKISNMMVLKGAIDLFAHAAAASSLDKFCKSASWELLQQFTEKLSDKKVGPAVEGLLTALCDLCGAGLIVKRVCAIVESSKAPTTHQCYLNWIKQRIERNGLAQMPMQSLVAFCLKEIEHKLAAVRSGAVEVLGAAYAKCGPRLLSAIKLDDIAPQAKQLLDNEFERVGFDPSQSQAASAEGQSAEDIFPRKDIMALMDKSIVTEMNFVDGKNSWQNRKKALDSVVSACEGSGHYLEFNKSTAELIKTIKLRINDTQSNLKPLAMSALGHLVTSFPTESAGKVLRTIAPAMLSGLSDNKRPMREATVASLQLAVSTSAPLFMAVVPAVGEAITSSTIGRQELLEWLNLHCDSFSGDCSDLASPLLSALLDKNAPVRVLSEQLLTNLISKGIVSKSAVEKASRDLAPANKRSLQILFDRLGAITVGSGPSMHGSGKVPAADVPSSASTPPSPSHSGAHASAELPLLHAPRDVPSAFDGASGGISASLLEVSDASAVAWSDYAWPMPPYEPSYNDLVALKTQWSSSLGPLLEAALFPVVHRFDLLTQEVFLPALPLLSNQLDSPMLARHAPFIFAWLCYGFYLREGGHDSSMQQLLELTERLLRTLNAAPAALILPHLIEICGTKHGEKHADQLRSVFQAMTAAVSPKVAAAHLLAGMRSNNKRTRNFCACELLQIVQTENMEVLDGVAWKELRHLLEGSSGEPGLTAPIVKLLRLIQHGGVAEGVQDAVAQITSTAVSTPVVCQITAALTAVKNSADRSARLVAIDQLKIFVSQPDRLEPGQVERLLDLLAECVLQLSSCSNVDASFLAVALASTHKCILLHQHINSVSLDRCLMACLRCGALAAVRIGSVDVTTAVRLAAHMIITELCSRSRSSTVLFQTLMTVAMTSRNEAISMKVVCRLADSLAKTLEQSDEQATHNLLQHLHICCSREDPSSAALHVLRRSLHFIAQNHSIDFIQRWISAANVPADSLVCKAIDHVATSCETRSSAAEDPLQGRIMVLIDQIVGSACKADAIAELHQIARKQPKRVDGFLSKLSPTLRAFVADSWRQLEQQPMASSLDSSSDASATEAMRILEGLKARPTHFPRMAAAGSHGDDAIESTAPAATSPLRPTSVGRGAASPFSRRNEKIRDSLSTLSAALDLPTTFRG